LGGGMNAADNNNAAIVKLARDHLALNSKGRGTFGGFDFKRFTRVEVL
jgi:hypothetical protein